MDPNLGQLKKSCPQCNREFWVIKQEQEFLKKIKLPAPTHCPACREKRRLRNRGERNLYRTICQTCKKEIIVTHNPETEKRKILCKQCYLDYFEKNSPLIT